MNIFVGTYNVNAKKLDGSLNNWLLANGRESVDVYALGFQEIVELNAINVGIDGTKTTQRAQYWQDKIRESLDSSGIRYSFLMEKYMVGLLVVVFIKEEIFNNVKDIRCSSLGCGMASLGNKGGVCIRMTIYDSSICFICTHLAAHREKVKERNADYRKIYDGILFSSSDSLNLPHRTDYDDLRASDLVTRPKYGAEKTAGIDQFIKDHDFIFWFGDLNYRINEDLSTDQVFKLCEEKNWKLLQEKDQLNIERSKKNVFHHFHEGLTNFAPTYKYEPGTDVYDQRPGKKVRAPAWCDRILWKITDPTSAEQIYYDSAPLLPSDHKPVRSLFKCTFSKVKKVEEKSICKQYCCKLENFKDSIRHYPPKIDLSRLTLEFDQVKYECETTLDLEIKNIGNTLAHWHFVSKTEESRVCKRWLSFKPTRGLLFPGEVATVRFTILIDKKTSQAINMGRDNLNDNLTLRLENSYDTFIGVAADYERSCFGMLLEELIYTPGPVRNTTPIEYRPGKHFDESVILDHILTDTKLSIPKELWRLVDSLYSSAALRETDLFVLEGDPQEVIAIRESLDTGNDFPSCSPHSIAQVIVSFLDALPQPILPPSTYPTSEIDPQNLRAWCRRFLESLPPINYNLFIYVLSFFRELLSESDYNRLTVSHLASICINVMTSLTIENDLTKEDREKRIVKQEILFNVIQYYLVVPTL